MVFFKVAPWKHMLRIEMKEKLAPRYLGTFEMIKRIGHVAYKLALSTHLANIYDVFHISLLRKQKWIFQD
jgi:hypothetical protein